MEYFDSILKTPEEIKEELDTASDAVADAQYDYRRLEEHKKIAQEQLTLTVKMEKNCSMAEAKSHAIADNNYKILIDGVIEGERKYSKAKSNYANLISKLDYMRSWISCQKHISK